MADLGSLTNESRINALFIGDSGEGKKCAMASFPRPAKYFDFDGRVRGLLGASWMNLKGIDHKYYPPIRLGANQPLMYKELDDDLTAMYTQAQVGQLPYKTVMLCSLSGETFGLLRDAVKLTHVTEDGKGKKNRWVGSMPMPDPGDYGYVSNGTKSILAFLRSLPNVHCLVSAHTVDKYGKPRGKDGEPDPYADSVIVGTKLSLSDKLAAEIPGGFDNVWHFSKEFDGNTDRFYVRFRGGQARTTFTKLPDTAEITGLNFYEFLMKHVETLAPADAVAPTNK